MYLERFARCIIPALAGVIPERRNAGRLAADYPRTRGGDPVVFNKFERLL